MSEELSVAEMVVGRVDKFQKEKEAPWSGSLLPRGPVTQEASIALNLFCNGN